MLTYTTLFIVCIIVAVVALVLYRVVSSSRSILSSKEPVSFISSASNPKKSKGFEPVPATPGYSGPNKRAAPASYAGLTPAAPTPNDNANWGWAEGGNQVREQHPHHSPSDPNAKHCSLYDVDPVAPPKRDVSWPHREDKLETGGTAYKVTRKVSKRAPDEEDSGKPWGW